MIESGEMTFLYKVYKTEDQELIAVFAQNQLASITREFIEANTPYEWLLESRTGDIVSSGYSAPEGTVSVQIPFPGNLPSWTIRLFGIPESLWTVFSRGGKGVFLYIFLFIVVLLGWDSGSTLLCGQSILN